MADNLGYVHHSKFLAAEEEFVISTYSLGLIVVSSSSTGASAVFLGSSYGLTKISESAENFSTQFEVIKFDGGIKIKNIHSASRYVEIVYLAYKGRI